MANKGSVTIKIDGDASGFEKTLRNLKQKTVAGLADVKAGIDLATAATQKLFSVASKGIDYNATIEQLQTSFEVMTGSAEKAAEVVERLRVMGAETPFGTMDLASTTQLLMQYGFTADEAIDRMRMLGDVAQGSASKMNSIALGYAQMSSAGKVNLVDIKQMITAGFNPLQEISERTGESMESLYDRISKGTMTVDEITESMRHATSEGGRFFQSMEKQSQTLNGRLSTLKDNVDTLLGSMTEGMSEELRTQLLPLATNLVAELQTAFDNGGYQGLINSATGMLPDLLNMTTGELQKAITGLSRWLPQGATQLMKALPTALRGASAVVPEITTALFEIASVVITDLIGMLPELAPILAEGLAQTFSSALEGVFKVITGAYKGIEQAIHQGQTKIAGMWVDNEEIAKYDFSVDVTVDEESAKTALATGIKNIATNLGTALTDGLPDVETVLTGLETEVRTWADQAYAKIDEWYQSEIDALNASGTTGEEYDAAYAQITEKAVGLRTAVEGSETALLEWLYSMAGKSTEYVQQHLGELDAILATYETAIQEIDKLTNKATDAAQNAFQVVRSGANADEATISMAVSYKVTEFKMDSQSAEDAYDAAIAELNEQLATKKITQEEYNTQAAAAAADLEAAKQAAKAAYEQGLREIFRGIAESEGIEQAVNEAGSNFNLAEVLTRAAEMLSFEPDGKVGDKLGTELTNGLAEYLKLDPEVLKSMQTVDVMGYLEFWANELYGEAQKALKGADNTKLQEAYAAALESGALEGTSFDTDKQAEQFAAILGLAMTNGATLAAPEALAAGESIVDNAESGAADSGTTGSGLGSDFGSGYVQGIRAWVNAAYYAAYTVAQSAAQGAAAGQDSASPSKVAMGLGHDFGEGYTIGLQESMAHAVEVARRMTGNVATSVDIIQATRVSNMPNLQQEIILANEQSQQPINLYVNGRELARVTASDTQQAQNWHNRRIALGVGK